ncbi:MAG: VCBS repeat-containing protein [Chloroflexi bacterium]|nr:VCBS repeat-containing protein [Chloroflexota bacterium]
MKRTLALTLIALLLARPGLPGVPRSPALPHTLTYVESSGGLETPQWEAGRSELEIGDVNGDGHPDIVSIGDHGSPYVGTQEHGIMVYFGDGAGNWSVYQNGNFGYGGIALGDVNNDGLMDAGYAMHHNYSGNDFGDQLIEVALGDGTGRNWTAWDDGLATNGETWGMFANDFADINSDGWLDIASLSFGCCNGVHVYLNHGDGTWAQSFATAGGNSNEEIIFGDVNADGRPDFAAADEPGTVYLGDGSGGFALADGNLPPPGFLGRPGPDLGDVNGDGRDDLSFCSTNGGTQVWVWAGGNTWQNFTGNLPASGTCAATQLADMNVDGFTDVVTFGARTLKVWGGDGAGNWTLSLPSSLPRPATTPPCGWVGTPTTTATRTLPYWQRRAAASTRATTCASSKKPPPRPRSRSRPFTRAAAKPLCPARCASWTG